MTIRDNKDYIRDLLYSYDTDDTTITLVWGGVLLTVVNLQHAIRTSLCCKL